MKSYEFVSANGIDVEVSIIGYYHDDAKDLQVVASNGFEEVIEDCADANDVLDALEEGGIEIDELPRHFAEMVIDGCMIVQDMTLDEALAYQREWEAARLR